MNISGPAAVAKPEMLFYAPGDLTVTRPPKAKSSTRRWVCPKCGTIIRSTKEVRVICADCMELFVKAD